MGKITKEQILFPGKTLEPVNLDFNSPEVKESIRKTMEAQEEILKRNSSNPSDRDKIVFGPCE